MEFKINYIIKAEVFDKIKQEKIYFTKEDSKIIEEIPEIIYDNNHLLGSGSIYEFLDFQIELYAKEQGHYIITCDYLPDNPGHQLADEYHNISTTDKMAVLKLAERLKVNGIVCQNTLLKAFKLTID